MENANNSKKVKATFSLSSEILERVRNAVFHLSGPPKQLTLARCTEEALLHHVKSLEKEHNEGKQFPSRRKLRVGRPMD